MTGSRLAPQREGRVPNGLIQRAKPLAACGLAISNILFGSFLGPFELLQGLSQGKAIPMCEHAVLFYDNAYPAEQVSEFLIAGLAAGDRLLVLLTASHRSAVEQCLRARQVRLEDTDCLTVDTNEVLSHLLVDGRLDMQLASEVLTPLMRPASANDRRRVRAVGDLAPELCAAGHTDDAVAFENLVHRLARENGAAVICAYSISTHGVSGGVDALLRLSAEHATIEFPERMWIQRLLSTSAPAGGQRLGLGN
jgi:hypothetical protein